MSAVVTIPGQTVTELIQYWASTSDNDAPAFVSVFSNGKKQVINRRDVYLLSKRFAHKLRSQGIGKGSIVCNALPNSIERVVTDFGITLSGAVSMNGQIFRSDGEDFKESIRTAKCSSVIVDPGVPKGARQLLFKEVPLGFEDNVKSPELPDLKQLIICERNEKNHEKDFLTSLLREADMPEYVAEVSPADLLIVLTTSGSTGYSKLVKFTHANICCFTKQVKAIEHLQPGEHFINCGPLGWAGSYPQWYLSCGSTRYFLDMHDGPIPDLPAKMWEIIVEEKIVYGFISPIYANTILTNKALWENSNWRPRCLCLAGQPIKKGVVEIVGRLCDAVDINYGITECNVVATHRITDPSTYEDNCAGYPGYNVQIKIVDKDMQEVDPGKTGQVLIKSPTLCAGYLNNELANNSFFRDDGWFSTDDAGYFGKDGKLYVEGRQSDSILRGTYILYPAWLERKMKEVPDVVDIVMVAVPDPLLHNEICACVVVNGVEGVFAASSENNIHDGSSVHGKSLGTINCCGGPTHSSSSRKESEVSQNEMSTSQDTSTCDSLNGFTNGKAKSLSPNLVLLEKQLRDFASRIELLHEKDPMRLVPKYYMFMDKYPMTNTGKISRKHLRELAADVLGFK
ncbi:unnamed protein product [Lymnaea stagnalis]|uniref:AMP-dependent synthetase/ligase domain-containing protein n=1 Tax=Lymnaea stagnalis TaxID=6523 RepID=A0AAV2I2V4_LYMST